jgi:hypothetical protein
MAPPSTNMPRTVRFTPLPRDGQPRGASITAILVDEVTTANTETWCVTVTRDASEFTAPDDAQSFLDYLRLQVHHAAVAKGLLVVADQAADVAAFQNTMVGTLPAEQECAPADADFHRFTVSVSIAPYPLAADHTHLRRRLTSLASTGQALPPALVERYNTQRLRLIDQDPTLAEAPLGH